MIEYRPGNLLHTPEMLIAHGCNANGVMGAGVAKAIRISYPGAYEAYREKYEKTGLHLGEIVPWVGSGRIILNCITQISFGRTPGIRYVDYDAIRKCMARIENSASRQQASGTGPMSDIKTMAMPRIGAGLGGGDWKVIEAIINEEIRSLSVIVYTG